MVSRPGVICQNKGQWYVRLFQKCIYVLLPLGQISETDYNSLMKNKNFAGILLIEDDPDHAQLVMKSLCDCGFSVATHHSSSGEKALEYLHACQQANSQQLLPQIIFLDLRLQKMDGLEVLKAIKSDEVLKKIPVVVMSCSDDLEDVKAAYANKANSYLVKPQDVTRFREILSATCKYWLGWNQLPSV